MEYIIYKIVCKDTNITDCYVGSTKDLSIRIIEHNKKCYNSNSNSYNYKDYNNYHSYFHTYHLSYTFSNSPFIYYILKKTPSY